MTNRLISMLARRVNRSWLRFSFQRSIHRFTKKNHGRILAEAEAALQNKEFHESDGAYLASDDVIVRQGYAFKRKTEQKFKNLYSGRTDERIMIHAPDTAAEFSAGASVFANLAESLDFIGVPAELLGWNENTREALDKFKPTVLLSSDVMGYLERIDWEAVRTYRKANRLKIGLSASLAEYGNTPLDGRLEWARKHWINFFYSFRDEQYVRERTGYEPFFDAGYKILYIPFGANILHYYPIPGFDRDLEYVFLGSRKREHAALMKDIARRHRGFVDGNGWKHAGLFRYNRDRDRYIYARAKTGLNVHLPEQLEWACEVNERTYQLAACGVPQIVDHPKILDKLFSSDAFFVADTPRQYHDYFEMIMRDPGIGQERASIAQDEVFAKHTTLHRADSLMQQLKAVLEPQA